MARAAVFGSTAVAPELGPVLHRSAPTVVRFQPAARSPHGRCG
ncbi:hypothetical protein [Streptomyces sp. NPDC001787]